MITVEQALTLLKGSNILGVFYTTPEHEEALDMAITALEAQQADTWIPITERLPEKNDEYLVSLEGHEVDVDIFKNGKWINWNTDDGYGINVIAWKPLDEPWKEEQP